MSSFKVQIFILILIALLIYSPSLTAPFIYDDYLLIVNNPIIRSLKNLPLLFEKAFYTNIMKDHFRPLQIISYIWDFKLWGLNPLGYHITNLFLHFLNALLLYFFISIVMGAQALIPFLSALFFLIHPANTFAVTYISGRADLLVLGFILLSLISYTYYLKYNTLFSGYISLGTFALALLSKEIAFLLLPLYLGSAILLEKKIPWRFMMVSLIISLAYLYLRGLLLPSYQWVEVPFKQRFLTAPIILLLYFKLIFLPFHLRLSYAIEFVNSPWNLKFFIPLIFSSGLVWFLFRIAKGEKMAQFGLYWYGVNFLFISNLFLPLNAPFAPHWLYVGMAGFLIYFFLISSKNFNRIYLSAIFGMGLFFSNITIQSNLKWKDPELFYQREIKYTPSNYKAHFNLGILYFNQGKYKKAEEEFKSSLKLNPRLYQAFFALGLLYEQKGKFELAKFYYRESLKINPDFKPAQERIDYLNR